MKIRETFTASSTRARFPSVRIHVVLTNVLLLTFLGQLEAAIINASSVSRADVGAAVASAANGDTVIIPAGTGHWTTSLNINKAITLQGSGTNLTIIEDDISSTNAYMGSVASLIILNTVS